jgi:hypothetical protein
MQLMFGRIISADFILPPKVSSCTRVTNAGVLLLAPVGLACLAVLLCDRLNWGDQPARCIVQVSVACRDLLKQMLSAEPSKRISIAGIMNHPWFLKDLPAGTHEMNARLQATDNVRSAASQHALRDRRVLTAHPGRGPHIVLDGVA